MVVSRVNYAAASQEIFDRMILLRSSRLRRDKQDVQE